MLRTDRLPVGERLEAIGIARRAASVGLGGGELGLRAPQLFGPGAVLELIERGTSRTDPGATLLLLGGERGLRKDRKRVAGANRLTFDHPDPSDASGDRGANLHLDHFQRSGGLDRVGRGLGACGGYRGRENECYSFTAHTEKYAEPAARG